MFNTKPFTLFLRVIPLLILMVVSLYFAYGTWQKYEKNTQFNEALSRIGILQTYEQLKLKEALCTVLHSSSHTENKCTKAQHEANKYLALLNSENANLESWIHQMEIHKESLTDAGVEKFEYKLGKQTTNSSVHSYFETIVLEKNMPQEQALLDLYKVIVDTRYATAIESFLLEYYLHKKTDISGANLIYWDRIIQASSLPFIEEGQYAKTLTKSLHALVSGKTFLTLSMQLDDMHLAILTGEMRQHALESTKGADWSVLLEKKEKILAEIQSEIENALQHLLSERINDASTVLAFFLFTLFLALLGLWFVYKEQKNGTKDALALIHVVNQLNALSSYDTVESNVMNEMLMKAKSNEEVYAHIYNRFQLLNEKCKQAQDEATSKSQFLSTLSHEIRTPLNGIIGFSKLLKGMGVTQDQEEFLALIDGSSNNLIAIVNDVLDLSKMNAAKMEIENVSFDIFETIETTIAPFVYRMDQKDIELGLFIDPFLAQYFCGDATKISQVLTNLVGNAMKFTEDYGKINVFVQCLHDREDESEIKFAVHDDGIGLTEEQMKNIFNAFSQATKNTSKKYGGTGLGLTISNSMVELMGGKLKVESKVDHGATFYFSLTLKKDKEKVAPVYPNFSEKIVGLALPVKNIKRQLDTNLEIYIRHLGAEFNYYYYDDIFEENAKILLPDLMIFDHHYARLSGELQQCASIDCKTVLMTNGTLRSRINPDRHKFDDVLLTPISLRKSIRILETTLKEVKHDKIQTKILNDNESFNNLNALVADDNMINRKLIKIILEKIGLGVTLTSDGKEAFEKYKKGSFDLVLMDIQMPIMDGVEATHAILAYEEEMKKQHTPIIAITANVGTHDKEHYLVEGMDDYMTKPVEIEMLKKMINKHCANAAEYMLKTDT